MPDESQGAQTDAPQDPTHPTTEVQDFSVLEIRVLLECLGLNPNITLAGDVPTPATDGTLLVEEGRPGGFRDALDRAPSTERRPT